jgi:hypothetical protein
VPSQATGQVGGEMIICIFLLFFLVGKLSMAAARAVAQGANGRQREQAARSRQAQPATGNDDAAEEIEPLPIWTALDDLQLSRLLKDSAS